MAGNSLFERIREKEAQKNLGVDGALSPKEVLNKRQSTLARSIGIGVNQGEAAIRQLAGDSQGADELRGQLAGTGATVNDFRDVNSLDSAGEYIAGLAGQTIGALAPAAAGAVGGVLAAPALGVSALPAALAGQALGSFAQFGGENLLAQRDAGVADEDLSYSRALATAAGQTALDSIGVGKAVGRVAKAAKAQKVNKSIGQRVGNIAAEAGKQVVEEAIPESLQGVLQNIQTQGLKGAKDLTGKEIVDQAIQDAVAGAILGAGIGGTTASARNAVEAELPQRTGRAIAKGVSKGVDLAKGGFNKAKDFFSPAAPDATRNPVQAASTNTELAKENLRRGGIVNEPNTVTSPEINSQGATENTVNAGNTVYGGGGGVFGSETGATAPTNQEADAGNLQEPVSGRVPTSDAEASRLRGVSPGNNLGGTPQASPIQKPVRNVKGNEVAMKLPDGKLRKVRGQDLPLTEEINAIQYNTVVTLDGVKRNSIERFSSDKAKQEGITVDPTDVTQVSQGGAVLLNIPEARRLPSDFFDTTVERIRPVAEAGARISIPETRLQTETGSAVRSVLEDAYGYVYDEQTNTFSPAFDNTSGNTQGFTQAPESGNIYVPRNIGEGLTRPAASPKKEAAPSPTQKLDNPSKVSTAESTSKSPTLGDKGVADFIGVDESVESGTPKKAIPKEVKKFVPEDTVSDIEASSKPQQRKKLKSLQKAGATFANLSREKRKELAKMPVEERKKFLEELAKPTQKESGTLTKTELDSIPRSEFNRINALPRDKRIAEIKAIRASAEATKSNKATKSTRRRKGLTEESREAFRKALIDNRAQSINDLAAERDIPGTAPRPEPEVSTQLKYRKSKQVSDIPAELEDALNILGEGSKAELNSLADWVASLDNDATKRLEELFGIYNISRGFDSNFGTEVEKQQRELLTYLRGSAVMTKEELEYSDIEFDFDNMFNQSLVQESVANADDNSSINDKVLDILYPPLKGIEFGAAVAIYKHILASNKKALKSFLSVPGNRSLAVRLSRQVKSNKLSQDQIAVLNAVDERTSTKGNTLFTNRLTQIVGNIRDAQRELSAAPIPRNEYKRTLNSIVSFLSTGGVSNARIGRLSLKKQVELLRGMVEMADKESSFAKYAEKEAGVSIDDASELARTIDWNSIKEEAETDREARLAQAADGFDTIGDTVAYGNWKSQVLGNDPMAMQLSGLDEDLSVFERMVNSELDKIESSKSPEKKRAAVIKKVVQKLEAIGAIDKDTKPNQYTIHVPGIGNIKPWKLSKISKGRATSDRSSVHHADAAANLSVIMSLLELSNVASNKYTTLINKPATRLAYGRNGRPVLLGEVLGGTGSRSHLLGYLLNLKRGAAFEGVMPRFLNKVIRSALGGRIKKVPGGYAHELEGVSAKIDNDLVARAIKKIIEEKKNIRVDASPAETFSGWARDKYNAQLLAIKQGRNKFTSYEDLQKSRKDWLELGVGAPLHPLEVKMGFADLKPGKPREVQLAPLWEEARATLPEVEYEALERKVQEYYASDEYKLSDPVIRSMGKKAAATYKDYLDMSRMFREGDLRLQYMNMDRPTYVDKEGYGLTADFSAEQDRQTFGRASESAEYVDQLRTEADFNKAAGSIAVKGLEQTLREGSYSTVETIIDSILKRAEFSSDAYIELADKQIRKSMRGIEGIPNNTTASEFVKLVEEGGKSLSEAADYAKEAFGLEAALLYQRIKVESSRGTSRPNRVSVSAAIQARGLINRGVDLDQSMISALTSDKPSMAKEPPVIVVMGKGVDVGSVNKLKSRDADILTLSTSDVSFRSKLKQAVLGNPNGTVVFTDEETRNSIEDILDVGDSGQPVTATNLPMSEELKDGTTPELDRQEEKFNGTNEVIVNEDLVDQAVTLREYKEFIAKGPEHVRGHINRVRATAEAALMDAFGEGHKVEVLVPEYVEGPDGPEITNPMGGRNQANAVIKSDVVDGKLSLSLRVHPRVLLWPQDDTTRVMAHETGHAIVNSMLLDQTPESKSILTAMYINWLKFLQAGSTTQDLPRGFAIVEDLEGNKVEIDSPLIDPKDLKPDMNGLLKATEGGRYSTEAVRNHATYLASFHEWAADKLSEQLLGDTDNAALRVAVAHAKGLHGQVPKIAEPSNNYVKDYFFEEISYESRGLEADLTKDQVAEQWWAQQIAHGNIADESFILGASKHLDKLFDAKTVKSLKVRAFSNENKRALRRFILASYPEATALELADQVDSDPAVAATAYIQAVSVGGLKVSPLAETFIGQTIDEALKKVGVQTESAVLNTLIDKFKHSLEAKDNLTVFHRNTLLADKAVKRMADKVGELYIAGEDKTRSFWQGAAARMRSHKNPRVDELADMFAPDPGSNTEGYFVAQNRKMNEFLNIIGEDFDGLSKAELLNVHRSLQLANGGKNLNALNKLNSKERKVANRIRFALKEIKKYLDESGVELGDLGSTYYPLVFEPEWFLKNQAEVVDRLQKVYQSQLVDLGRNALDIKNANRLSDSEVAAKAAEILVNGIIEAGGFMDDSSVVNRGAQYQPSFRFANTRMLNFIFDDPETAQWLQNGFSDDVVHTITSYVKSATKRAEITKRLGVDNKELHRILELAKAEDPNLDTDDVLTSLDAMLGVIGIRTNEKLHALMGMDAPTGEVINPRLRSVLGTLSVVTYMQILALAPVVAATDFMGILVRTQDLDMFARSVITGLKTMVKAGRKNNRGEELGQALGTITNTIVLDMLEVKFDTNFIVGNMKRVEQAFFKVTGMVGITRASKVAATAGAEQFLIKHVVNPDGNSARYLDELGITGEELRSALSENKKKLKILSPEERANASPEERVKDDRIRASLVKLVDSMVLRPDAGVQPAWFADPHFQLAKMLKSFTYAFYYNVLYRVIHEAKNANLTPIMMVASYIPAMIMATALQDILKGYEDPEWRVAKEGLFGYTVGMANKAGLFGPLGLIGDLHTGYEYNGVAGIAGGVLGPWTNSVKHVYKAVQGDDDEALKSRLSLLPFGNIIKPWWIYE